MAECVCGRKFIQDATGRSLHCSPRPASWMRKGHLVAWGGEGCGGDQGESKGGGWKGKGLCTSKNLRLVTIKIILIVTTLIVKT